MKACGRSSTEERHLSKVKVGVRFPSVRSIAPRAPHRRSQTAKEPDRHPPISTEAFFGRPIFDDKKGYGSEAKGRDSSKGEIE